MRYLFVLFSICLSLVANSDLKKSDVRETFEEMLGLHIEHNKIVPLLIKRSIKIYLEQFDGLKIYLVDPETKPFFHFSKKQLENALEHYQIDDLTSFKQVNSYICESIDRSRALRREIERELILSVPEENPARGESYLSYADTEIQLKNRLRKQLTRILLEEKQLNQMDQWTPNDREKIFLLWEKRFQRKEDEYVKASLDTEHYLVLNTLKALAKSLDAHTTYFSPDEALEMRMTLEKQFEGVGVVLRESIDGVIIADLVKESPAAKSNKIQIGDQIVSINGKQTSEMTYEEILRALQGDGKKELILGLERKEEKKIYDVTLSREKIMMNEDRLQSSSFPYAEGQIGVLTLPSFYEGGHQSSAELDIREAIKKLKKQAPLKGLVLDMRENLGGFLSQAVKVAGLFITKGVIVISKYSRGEIKYLRNLNGQLCFDGPLIILTSRASASAAEIVAQALQDYGVALVVGDEETYGKGTIQYQTVTDKEAKAFYKVTVGRYYTVSGRSTQIVGVKADIVVPTIFASYKIGERFLENPLPTDQIAAAYVDPLTDVDYRSRAWFQKNYLPNLHQPQEKWQKILPKLQENSTLRLQNNKNFAAFLQEQSKKKGRSARSFKRVSNPSWGEEDLQLNEAIQIMQDMIAFEKNL